MSLRRWLGTYNISLRISLWILFTSWLFHIHPPLQFPLSYTQLLVLQNWIMARGSLYYTWVMFFCFLDFPIPKLGGFGAGQMVMSGSLMISGMEIEGRRPSILEKNKTRGLVTQLFYLARQQNGGKRRKRPLWHVQLAARACFMTCSRRAVGPTIPFQLQVNKTSQWFRVRFSYCFFSFSSGFFFLFFSPFFLFFWCVFLNWKVMYWSYECLCDV